ncbi:MAG TPA: TPM domain-containing protein [Planctomycetota bacterium]|nr:TPM domain-containing protein [Planctomycetota bacterium]
MLLLYALLLPAPQDIPRLETPVVDRGGVLHPEQEETGLHMIRKIKESNGVDVALLTVDTTGGREIGEFADEVARANGFARSERRNALLMVVSVQDRRAHFVAGNDVERKLPASLRERIFQEEMAPFFFDGRIGAGTFAGLAAVVTAVRGDYRLPSDIRRYRGRRPLVLWWFYLVGAIVYIVVIHRKLGEFGGGFVVARSARRVGRSPDFQGGGSSGSWT